MTGMVVVNGTTTILESRNVSQLAVLKELPQMVLDMLLVQQLAQLPTCSLKNSKNCTPYHFQHLPTMLMLPS
jgi:hypothetical protein